MVAWHLAAAIFLFRWIFRDPKVDLRFLAVGAVLPDLIDLGAATVLGASTGELWAHSLLVPSLVGIVVLLATRRGRRRRAWMALVVAWLLHILIDAMWLEATVFWWPLFGWDLVDGGFDFWVAARERAFDDPWRWLLEAAGLVYLGRLWISAGLSQRDHRHDLARTGRLPQPS